MSLASEWHAFSRLLFAYFPPRQCGNIGPFGRGDDQQVSINALLLRWYYVVDDAFRVTIKQMTDNIMIIDQ